MKPIEDRDGSEGWLSEGWTGEQDSVAAVALAVCLAIAALIFLIVAVTELAP